MPATSLHISSIARLPPTERARVLAQLTEEDARKLLYDWEFQARPAQLPPAGDWRTWLFLGGRGAGKSRSGAEWVRGRVKAGFSRLALIAPTAADARDIMVEGESGLLSVCYEDDRDAKGVTTGRPEYEPSKRRLTWRNGATATLFSAEEPDRLRGPQHMAIWADELAAWTDPEAAWDMAAFGLRLGPDPRIAVTTTPRPIPIIRELLKSPTCAVTRDTTYANRANLAEAFLEQIVTKYEGTRLGRQELEAEILDEAEGALWNWQMIERARVDSAPQMRRVVIGVDPAVTAKVDSNLTGIVAAGLGRDGKGYVLADGSGRYSPDGWARKAVALFESLRADRFVAEGNQGGDMVRHTIHSVMPNAPVTVVHASRGKQARAEPIAALYEQQKIKHCGAFPELESQMCVAGDTLVSTRRGQIEISNLTVDDYVLTRVGYSPIKWVGKTGIKPTLTIKTSLGFHVKLSYNHPVFTGDRFVRADELKVGDRVTECHGNHSAIASSLRARNTTEDLMTIIVRTVRARTAGSCCMSQFGKMSSDLYQKVKRFITSILIPPTMTFATSNALLAKNTPADILQGGHAAFLPTFGVQCGGKNGRNESRGLFNAVIAAKIFGRPDNAPNFASRPVVRNSIIIAIEETDSAPLWDLTVDGLPEFFANGILVHNCTWQPLGDQPSPDRIDAMVWALTNLMIQQQSTAAFGVYGQV